MLFDRFEVLASLSRVHLTTASDHDPRTMHAWFVPGRWHYQRALYLSGGKSLIRDWLAQADSEQGNWPPLAAGMFGGDYERFSKLRAGFENYMRTVT